MALNSGSNRIVMLPPTGTVRGSNVSRVINCSPGTGARGFLRIYRENREKLFRKSIREILFFPDGDNFDEKYIVIDEECRPVLPDPYPVPWSHLRAVPDFYHIVPLIRVFGKLF